MPPVSSTFPLALLCLLLVTVAAIENKNHASRHQYHHAPSSVRQPHTSFQYQRIHQASKNSQRPSNYSQGITHNKPKRIEATRPKGEIPLL